VSNVVNVTFGGRPTVRRDDPPAEPQVAAVTLYGLDKCSTCDKARKWLDREKIAHRFVDYRREPIAADTLKSWAKTLGWEKLVNRASLTWRALPVERKSPGTDAEWLLLVRDHPSLVRRPVVVMPDGGVSVGFTDKSFQRLFKSDA
jgi:Spx/MgsR family transcriptional regulator